MLGWLKTRWVDCVVRVTPRCAEMARLCSEGMERNLPLRLRWRMRLHLMICAWCGRYQRQLKFLRRAAPHLHEHGGDESVLTTEARGRIKDRLRHAQAATPQEGGK